MLTRTNVQCKFFQRSEVEGASPSWAAVRCRQAGVLREHKIRIILQTAPERIAEPPDAPSLAKFGDNEIDRHVFATYASGSAIGRSGHSGSDRIQLLRDAFQAMVNDPRFTVDIGRLNVELDPLPGAERAQRIANAPSLHSGGRLHVDNARVPGKSRSRRGEAAHGFDCREGHSIFWR
jgi:hypothetical protein